MSKQITAGRFYVNNDGGFTPEQYADMLMTKFFDTAKFLPQPLKSRVLEGKLQLYEIARNIIAEAMVDERRRVGRHYELNDKKKARLLLPAGMGQRLDQGGVWDENYDPSTSDHERNELMIEQHKD